MSDCEQWTPSTHPAYGMLGTACCFLCRQAEARLFDAVQILWSPCVRERWGK